MLKIRNGVFETNSSSTHTLTICTRKEYDRWKNKEVYFSPHKANKWTEKEEAINDVVNNKYFKGSFENCSIEEIDEILKDWEYYTYENYGDYSFENYAEGYVTESGDKIVVFGYYGYDG